MASKKRYERINKTKEMAEVFKRKSGPMNKKPSRTKQKAQWKKEVEHDQTGTD
jgi:hypothetical protein